MSIGTKHTSNKTPAVSASIRLIIFATLASFLRPECIIVGTIFAVLPSLTARIRIIFATSSLIPLGLSWFVSASTGLKQYSEIATSGFSKYLNGNLLEFPGDLALELSLIGFQFVLMFFSIGDLPKIVSVLMGVLFLAILIFSVSRKCPFGVLALGLMGFYGLWAVGVASIREGIPSHYLIAAVFPAALALGGLINFKSLQTLHVAPTIIAALTISILFPSPSYASLRKEFYYNSDFSRSMEIVSKLQVVECMGFYKPRVAKLWLLESALDVEVRGLRSIPQAQDLVGDGCALVITSLESKGQGEISSWIEDQNSMIILKSGGYKIALKKIQESK